jgi:hypothetical protein
MTQLRTDPLPQEQENIHSDRIFLFGTVRWKNITGRPPHGTTA